MANGTVKWLGDQKSFGSIGQENRPKAFVHHSAFSATGFKYLNDGDQSAPDSEKGRKGPYAVNVTVI